MPKVQRLQHIGFRFADAVCSVAAFSFAYVSCASIQKVFLVSFPGILNAINRFVPASATGSLPSWQNLLWIGIVVTLAMSVTLEYGDDAKPVSMRNPLRIVLLLLTALAVSACAVSTLFYALHVPLYSRLFVFPYIGYLFIWMTVSYRLAFRNALLRREQSGKPTLRMAIVGTCEGVETYLTHAKEAGFRHVDIAGCLLTDEEKASRLSIPVLGHVSVLGDLLIHKPIDEVMIVLPGEATPWLSALIEHCDYFRVSVHIIHEALLRIELRDLVSEGSRLRVPALTLSSEEDAISDALAWKRVVDVFLSAVALILLSPLMALIAITIKLTTPELPVFYTWSAVGYRGHHFKGYKFTTMVADADQRKEALAHLNEMEGPVFKIKNDPRMTPIGKFLRKYSLNELPQFWSVFLGDMSLVGPRPALPNELKRYELWHKRKLSVRPGITCFWQVRGRNAITSFDDWVKMDLEYIKRRSMRTDMSILFQTVKVVLRGSGS